LFLDFFVSLDALHFDFMVLGSEDIPCVFQIMGWDRVFRVRQVEFGAYITYVLQLFADVFTCSHFICVDPFVPLVKLSFKPCDLFLYQIDHVNLLVSGIDFKWFVQELEWLKF